jgi:hypothetical protein
MNYILIFESKPIDLLLQFLKLVFKLVIVSLIFTLLNKIGLKSTKIRFLETLVLLLLIFTVFLFFKKHLIKFVLSNIDGKIYLEISYVKFLFFMKNKKDILSNFKFSNKEEFTSRSSKSSVFKIYYNSILLVRNDSFYIGINKKQISEVLLYLEKIILK